GERHEQNRRSREHLAPPAAQQTAPTATGRGRHVTFPGRCSARPVKPRAGLSLFRASTVADLSRTPARPTTPYQNTEKTFSKPCAAIRTRPSHANKIRLPAN